MYSQNNEEQYILDYFKDLEVGHVLDIGANDGKTFSNSLALIERGWIATLVEPNSQAFEKLQKLHEKNNYVNCVNCAISDVNGEIELHVNSPHIAGDIGLLSTLVEAEKERWKGAVTYDTVMIKSYRFDEFMRYYQCDKFDFITIDAEGMDYTILSQIDLRKVECKMICIEYNGKDLDKYINYCEQFGLKVKAMNAENLIMAL